MKLWQKISLICSVILIAVVTACAALLLGMAKNRLLTSAYEQTEKREQNLEYSFLKEMDYHAAESDSAAVTRSLLHYCFTRVGESAAVLVVDGETICSQLSFSPADYLIPADNGARVHYSGVINGKEYYIVAGRTRISTLPEKECVIYLAEDISPIYNSIRAVMWRFLLYGLVCTAIGLGMIIVLVRHTMTPLYKLQNAASAIASGNYTQRAAVETADEIGALALNFNHMAQSVQHHVNELTATAQRQQLFIGAVTHEFKTPLTCILLNADTLQNTYMSEDEQQKALHSIQTQAEWLECLVQKMLRLLTIDREMSFAEISTKELVERVQASMELPLKEKGISLSVQCEEQTISADMDLMQSALINLVDNAAKASKAGQEVRINAHENMIEVVDNGRGIPRDAVQHITEPFFMVDKSRSKKSGGVGLGLALVKEIVRVHNAEIEVNSEEGVGTTVRIIIKR